MSINFKNSGDFKYYLYISDAKLEMLYQQVASSSKDKKSFEWSLDLKALKITRKVEAEDESDRDDRLKAVVQALEESELVGTIQEPKDYVKGILAMRWGLFRDAGRPSEEPPLVFFGGGADDTVFGLGGSARHVIGNAGSSATGSRSVTPYLVAHLLNGMGLPEDGWVTSREYDDEYPHHDGHTCAAISLAVDHLKGPEQNLEFCAKVLLQQQSHDPYTNREGITKVLLGSPLYVALSHPWPKDLDDY